MYFKSIFRKTKFMYILLFDLIINNKSFISFSITFKGACCFKLTYFLLFKFKFLEVFIIGY